MRFRGLILLVLLALGFGVVSKLVFAGGDEQAVNVVSSSPVAAACVIKNGATVVSISAADRVGNVVLYVGTVEKLLVDSLPAGWSVSKSISGVNQAVRVQYEWRGAKNVVTVPCQ